MARVKMEDIVDHLSSEIRRALQDAVSQNIPKAQFDERQLFRDFKRAAYKRCSVWEHVPDEYVDTD